MTITNLLLYWFDEQKRNLPWRSTSDAYKIWLSEIILQQTKVEQGLIYYTKFTEKYPQIESLASASLNEVLKLWQGLGYYTRARNLHLSANFIVENYNGVFPSDYKKIRELKGVGDYTAAAIASIAYNLPYAAVDGNAYRVLSRYFGIVTPIDTSEGKKEFQKLAQTVLDKERPGDFNQAVMDLGAIICTPKAYCEICPLNKECYAYNKALPKDFPIKSKKGTVKDRYFYYFVIQTPEGVFVRQRKEKDIWHSLYEFPLISKEKEVSLEDLKQTKEFQNLFGEMNIEIIDASNVIKHQLSHQTLYCKFFSLILPDKIESFHNYFSVNAENFKKLSIPRVIEKYILSNEMLKFMN